MRGQHGHFKIFIQKPLGCSNITVKKLCKYLKYFACNNSLVLDTIFEPPCIYICVYIQGDSKRVFKTKLLLHTKYLRYLHIFSHLC